MISHSSNTIVMSFWWASTVAPPISIVSDLEQRDGEAPCDEMNVATPAWWAAGRGRLPGLVDDASEKRIVEIRDAGRHHHDAAAGEIAE
jgi:hypothetical protein